MSDAVQPTLPRSGVKRAVVQYDLADNVVARFPSARAASRATGLDPANIARVANHTRCRHRCGGFVWVWADDPFYLAREYRRTGDITFRNRLIESHVPLVRRIADVMRARLPREVQRDDLISVGVIGLMEAVESFDPALGVRLSTFASRRIRGAMIDELRKVDYIPRLSRERAAKLRGAIDKFLAANGRSPTDQELGTALNLTQEQLTSFKRNVPRQHSLSMEVDNCGSLMEVLVAPPPKVPFTCEPSRLRDVLLKFFSLTDALIIRCYHFDGMTMKQIGPALGVSESRVSQRHTKLVRILRKRFSRDEFSNLISGEFA